MNIQNQKVFVCFGPNSAVRWVLGITIRNGGSGGVEDAHIKNLGLRYGQRCVVLRSGCSKGAADNIKKFI